MNITVDAEIYKVECATEEEVDDFGDGQIAGPELDPMRPYLDTGRHTSWNDELTELFVDHFEQEQEVKFTKHDRKMVEEMFLARLSRLSRRWREYQTLNPEMLKEKDRRKREFGRRNTRRVDVS